MQARNPGRSVRQLLDESAYWFPLPPGKGKNESGPGEFSSLTALTLALSRGRGALILVLRPLEREG